MVQGGEKVREHPKDTGVGLVGLWGTEHHLSSAQSFCEEPINTGASRGLTYVAMRREGLRRQCGAVEIVAN